MSDEGRLLISIATILMSVASVIISLGSMYYTRKLNQLRKRNIEAARQAWVNRIEAERASEASSDDGTISNSY